MAYFSNGTEGMMYQEKYCHNCQYWNDADYERLGYEVGCPIWLLHEIHVGDKAWQPTLDTLIPMVPKEINGIRHLFAGQCSGFWAKNEAR